jgi:hypothetical protein
MRPRREDGLKMRTLLQPDVRLPSATAREVSADSVDHRPTLRIASDIYAHNDEQREAAGLPPPRYNDPKKDNQQATDAEVYDRFKKR